MYVRSLLVSGATAGTHAPRAPVPGTQSPGAQSSGSRGLVAAADTSGTSDHYLYLQDYYYEQYRIDYQNYLDASGTAGGQPAAGYYYQQYQDDYSTYLFYTSQLSA